MRESKEREQRKLRYADAKARAEKQESGGGPSAFKVPKGITIFKWEKPGNYKLRILPYRVSERAIDHRFADPGFMHFEYSYWVHSSLGLDNRGRHCCLRETFHKPCPICEWLNTLDRWGSDKDTYNTYRPKQRQLFALMDVDAKDKGIQLYEGSFFSGAGQMSLGQWIDNMIKANPDKYAAFFHLTDGMNLHINVKQGKPFNGSPTWNIAHVEAVEAKDLDESILDEIPSLDELPIELEYAELEEIFQQKQPAGVSHDQQRQGGNKTQVATSRDTDDDDDKWTKKPGKKTEDLDFEAGDDVMFEGDRYTVKRITPDGVVVLEDEDGIATRVEGSDVNEITLAPKKSAGKKKEEAPARGKGKPVDDEDEDEDTDESSEDEESDEDEDEDDSELEPDEDDDEEEEEASEDDSELEPDDDEDEEPPAKKPGKKPGRR